MTEYLKATFNIPIKVHWSAVLAVLATFLWGYFGAPENADAIYQGLANAGVLATLYSMVLLHEMGHCFEALKRGIMVDQITLWFLGGIAHIDLSKPFIKPDDELWISLAGPAVNAVLIVLSVPILKLSVGTAFEAPMAFFVAINAVLLFFNMLPAFPMDGGRMLRAGLCKMLDRERARVYTSYTALAFGILFFTYGALSVKIGLALIGILVIAINFKRINGDKPPVR